jgi:hypothetical protein
VEALSVLAQVHLVNRGRGRVGRGSDIVSRGIGLVNRGVV